MSATPLTFVNHPAYSCGTATASGTRRDVTTWKERHEEALAEQAKAWKAYLKATADRGRALLEGEAELGTQAAVARELGVSRATVNRAIKALQKKQDPS
jgi:DNA invertase Pin-like site-specific DNA recombinase